MRIEPDESKSVRQKLRKFLIILLLGSADEFDSNPSRAAAKGGTSAARAPISTTRGNQASLVRREDFTSRRLRLSYSNDRLSPLALSSWECQLTSSRSWLRFARPVLFTGQVTIEIPL